MALKTKRSDRTVAIPSALAAQLAERRLASGASANALVFARLDGTPYSHSAADRALAGALSRAGIEHASWHDLRHTHVSLLFAAGRDLVSIAARIGDSIQTVLRTYAHEFDAARRRAEESDALDAIYGNAMETRQGSSGQQPATECPADLALEREKRSTAQ
jgi:integrase